MPNKSTTNFRLIITTLLVGLEVLLLFLILNDVTNYTNILEFSAVVVAFVLALELFSQTTKTILTQVALLFTVCADFCLEILQPMQQSVAMTFFLCVQLCYMARLLLALKTTKWRTINLVIRLIFIIVAEIVTAVVLKDKFDYLSCVSILYYTNLVLNLILAFSQIKQAPLFALGLLLFLCCDTFVGLQCAANTYLKIPSDSILSQIIFILMSVKTLPYMQTTR